MNNRRGTIFSTILLAAVGPLLLLALPRVPFANVGSCDPWYVFGQFYWLPHAAGPGWFPHARQVARLPETIPGYLLTTALHGIGADYAYFLLSFTLTVVFMYFAARELLGPLLALPIALFFALHPLVIGNFSTTLNSWALTYDAISLYLVCRAARSGDQESTQLLFWSGVAMGFAMNAWLGIIAFGIGNYIYWLVFAMLRRSCEGIAGRLQNLALPIAAAMVGIAVASIAQGLLDVFAFHGNFWQIFNQFDAIPNVSRQNASVFYISDWYLHGSSAGIIAAIAVVGSLNVWLFHRISSKGVADDERRKHALSISVAVLAMTALLVAYTTVGGIFLQYDYYYYYLLPYLALVLGAALVSIGAASAIDPYTLVMFSLAAFAVTLVKTERAAWLYIAPDQALLSMALAVALGILCVWIGLRGRRPGRAWLYAYLCCLVLMLLVDRPNLMGSQIWGGGDPNMERESYIGIRRALAFLSQQHFVDAPLFWIDSDEKAGDVGALSTSYMFCGYHHFPAIDPDLWKRPGRSFFPGVDVVVVTGRVDARRAADNAFSQLRLKANRTAQFTVRFDHSAYQLLVYHVEKALPLWFKRAAVKRQPLSAQVRFHPAGQRPSSER